MDFTKLNQSLKWISGMRVGWELGGTEKGEGNFPAPQHMAIVSLKAQGSIYFMWWRCLKKCTGKISNTWTLNPTFQISSSSSNSPSPTQPCSFFFFFFEYSMFSLKPGAEWMECFDLLQPPLNYIFPNQFISAHSDNWRVGARAEGAKGRVVSGEGIAGSEASGRWELPGGVGPEEDKLPLCLVLREKDSGELGIWGEHTWVLGAGWGWGQLSIRGFKKIEGKKATSFWEERELETWRVSPTSPAFPGPWLWLRAFPLTPVAASPSEVGSGTSLDQVFKNSGQKDEKRKLFFSISLCFFSVSLSFFFKYLFLIEG